MSHGPLWDRMNAQPRSRASKLTRADVPDHPGVYAWYRRGRAVYVGKGDRLVERAWADHMSQSKSLATSAFRRNIAELLGYGLANHIKQKHVRLTLPQLATVREWVVSCSVAWIEVDSIKEAKRLEDAMKAERLPPLTKR